jgi:hypothetical protein
MSETKAVNAYRALYEKSAYLHIRSVLLRERARDLRFKSQRLREKNTVSAVINPHRWRQKADPSFSPLVSVTDTSGD